MSRLVKCNVAQGLEVIVRSLEDGSVMVVDRDRAYSGASWISGITCYIYQLQVSSAATGEREHVADVVHPAGLYRFNTS